MKLFVWEDPYPVSYGTSLVFAVAETVDDARGVAEAQRVQDAMRRNWRHGGVIDGPHNPLPLGEPTRIVELPCAEWHEWSE